MRELLCLIFVPLIAHANNLDAAFQQGLQAGQSHQQAAVTMEKQFNPNTTYPHYTENPSPTKYYEPAPQQEPSMLTQEALHHLQETPAGHDLLNSIQHRPQYQISPQDIQHGQVLETQANSLVHDVAGSSYCLEGNCTSHEYQKNQDFAQSVSALSGINDAAKSFDSHSLFQGHVQHCRDDAANFSNCCSPSGWGQDMQLAHCTQEEQALGKNRQAGITIYVGRYCAHHLSWPLDKVCVEHQQSYCVFESKLARIIQQQGRGKQLRISFGTAETPDCRGLTPEQLQTIDLTKINFSDYYADVQRNTKSPNVGDIQHTVNQHIQQFQQSGQAHG